MRVTQPVCQKIKHMKTTPCAQRKPTPTTRTVRHDLARVPAVGKCAAEIARARLAVLSSVLPSALPRPACPCKSRRCGQQGQNQQ